MRDDEARPSACASELTISERTLCDWFAPIVIATEIEPGPTISGIVSG